MRKTIAVASAVALPLLLILTLGGVNAFAQQKTAEAELVQIERDWCAASMKKDASTLNRILADDYTSVGSRGGTATKSGELADLPNPDSTVTVCTDTNVKVRVYGDAAVVTGLGTRSGTYKGVPYKDRQALWTDTFVKKIGRAHV